MGQAWERGQPYRVVYLNPHSQRASGAQGLGMDQQEGTRLREVGEESSCHRDVRVLSPEPLPHWDLIKA